MTNKPAVKLIERLWRAYLSLLAQRPTEDELAW